MSKCLEALLAAAALLALAGSDCGGPSKSRPPNGGGYTFFKNDPSSVKFRLALARAGARDGIFAVLGEELPPDVDLLEYIDSSERRSYYAVKMAPELDGNAIERMYLAEDKSLPGTMVLYIEFKDGPEGADKMGALTRDNIGKTLIVQVGETIISTPVIQAEVHKRAQIMGDSEELEKFLDSFEEASAP